MNILIGDTVREKFSRFPGRRILCELWIGIARSIVGRTKYKSEPSESDLTERHASSFAEAPGDDRS
jgi:hypothetical protein